MAKKKVDWMNCTFMISKTYDPELIRRMYDPKRSVVMLLGKKWKRKKD